MSIAEEMPEVKAAEMLEILDVSATDIPLVFDVKKLAEILGVSLSTAYVLMKRADFPVIYVTPTRRRIYRVQFLRWLDGMNQTAKA